MAEVLLNNGLKAKYIGSEMSGDVYMVKHKGIKTHLIDISNGFYPIDFYGTTGDFEPCSRANTDFQPHDKSIKSNYGVLEHHAIQTD